MTTQTFHATNGLHQPGHRAGAGAETKLARGRRRDHHKGTVEFRLIYAAAFVIFLFASAFERALPARWVSAENASGQRKSVLGRAKESASIAAGYAFMG